MKQNAFEQIRKANWAEFQNLLERSEGTSTQKKMNHDERTAFLSLFELLAKDLSLAQARGYSLDLISKLNDLVVRGHYVIHSSRTTSLTMIREFFTSGFPSEVRRARYFVLIAFISFVVPGIVIGTLIQYDPEYVSTVFDPVQIQKFEAMYTMSQDRIGRERSDASDLYMFGFYIYNNAQIGIQVFIGGVLFCVLSILVLGFNGLYLSAVVSHLITVGLGTPILSFVAGHSAFELTAIVLSGAAGIMLGYALIHPGHLSRTQALQQTGLQAAKIVAGATFMFILAAFIEAFWSSLGFVPPGIKYLVGFVLWTLTLSYFLFAGAKNGNRTT